MPTTGFLLKEGHRKSSLRPWLVLALAVLAPSVVLAGKQRTSKDWSKMTEADWERIDKEWETPEEEEE